MPETARTTLANSGLEVGSMLLVLQEPDNVAVWCYLVGSVLFLAHAFMARRARP